MKAETLLMPTAKAEALESLGALAGTHWKPPKVKAETL